MDLLLNLLRFAVSIFRQNFFEKFQLTSGFYIRLYTGQIHNMTPPSWLCIIQSSMIYASGAMVGASTLIFMLHVSFWSQIYLWSNFLT